MKGDPRVAAKCPLCPHVVKPRTRRAENHYTGTTNTRQILRNAMRMHFYWAHPELTIVEMSLLLDRVCGATATMQTQIVDPMSGPTMLIPCPVPGCGAILHSWLEEGRGKYLSQRRVIRQAIQQHIRQRHPALSPREVSLLLDQAELNFIVEKAGPDRQPQGPGAGGPALLDPVAPARPPEEAHAPGRVEERREVPPIKVIARTSKTVTRKSR